MKKDLGEIRDKLENEIDTAQAMAEVLLFISSGIYGFERNGLTFQSVSSAFDLFADIFAEHVQSLNSIANCLVDFDNDLKIK